MKNIKLMFLALIIALPFYAAAELRIAQGRSHRVNTGETGPRVAVCNKYQKNLDFKLWSTLNISEEFYNVKPGECVDVRMKELECSKDIWWKESGSGASWDYAKGSQGNAPGCARPTVYYINNDNMLIANDFLLM